MRFAELADAVSREIARRRIPAEQERQLAVLLHHLISGAPLSEAMERQAAESGIHLECPHILMWIQADAPELRGALGCTRQKSAAGRWARTCGAHCRRMAFIAWRWRRTTWFALEMPLAAGDGRTLPPTTALSAASAAPTAVRWVFRKQTAVPARRSAWRREPETPCVTDDPAGVVRLLEESSPAETDAYIHRQLGTLLRQPEPRRQELLDTLASWLRCMGNQRRMARELHLHYNTVSYRLQQLWLLLEADPVDPMKRLALETALYLYRYRRT